MRLAEILTSTVKLWSIDFGKSGLNLFIQSEKYLVIVDL